MDQKYKEGDANTIATHKRKTRRPCKITERTINLIHRQVEGNPVLTSKQIKNNNSQLLSNVTTQTVRNVLRKKLKYGRSSVTRKPLLTKRHKKNRVRFAVKYLKSFSANDWKAVLWTDEASFCVSADT